MDSEKFEKAVSSIANDEQQSDALLENVRHYWNHGDVSMRIRQYVEIDVDKAYSVFVARIHSKNRRISMWTRIVSVSVAAVLLAGIILTGLFFEQKPDPRVMAMLDKSIPVLSDSLPRLRLPNGKVVILSWQAGRIDSMGLNAIVGKSGMALTTNDDAPVEMLELSIPHGCQYQLALPDGSIVSLNSGSSIRFPNRYEASRYVYLSGEAYFDVKKDGTSFDVHCAQGTIHVLGTTFNVRSYGKAKTSVSLYTGNVRYESKGRIVELSPGESLVQQGDDISLHRKETLSSRSWKDGIISFDDECLGDVMADIERIYDVDVVFVRDVGNLHFTGQCKRTTSIEDIMRIMGATEEFDYEIEGRTIYIK